MGASCHQALGRAVGQVFGLITFYYNIGEGAAGNRLPREHARCTRAPVNTRRRVQRPGRLPLPVAGRTHHSCAHTPARSGRQCPPPPAPGTAPSLPPPPPTPLNTSSAKPHPTVGTASLRLEWGPCENPQGHNHFLPLEPLPCMGLATSSGQRVSVSNSSCHTL